MTNTNKVSISVVNNRLVFKTFSDYENFVDIFNNDLRRFYNEINVFSGFISYEKSIASEMSIDLDEDEDILEGVDFLKNILNDKFIVQIDKYIIKINPYSELSYVLDSRNSDQMGDLLSENTTNPNIMVFSNTDDGIDLLKSGSSGTIKSTGNAAGGLVGRLINRGGTGGGGTSCPHAKTLISGPIKAKYGNKYRIKYCLFYFNGYIYHVIHAYIKNQHKFLFFWLPQNAQLECNYSCNYTVKCRAPFINPNGVDSAWTSHLKTKIYPGSAFLSKYDVYAVFHNYTAGITSLQLHIQWP